jgi:hypothetical protein
MTTFMLILITVCGNTYVLDYNMTWEDCTSRVADYDIGDTIICEAEQ